MALQQFGTQDRHAEIRQQVYEYLRNPDNLRLSYCYMIDFPEGDGEVDDLRLRYEGKELQDEMEAVVLSYAFRMRKPSSDSKFIFFL